MSQERDLAHTGPFLIYVSGSILAEGRDKEGKI
jgi:hypothetical protein